MSKVDQSKNLTKPVEWTTPYEDEDEDNGPMFAKKVAGFKSPKDAAADIYPVYKNEVGKYPRAAKSFFLFEHGEVLREMQLGLKGIKDKNHAKVLAYNEEKNRLNNVYFEELTTWDHKYYETLFNLEKAEIKSGQKKPTTKKPTTKKKPSTEKPTTKKKPSTEKPTTKKKPSAEKPTAETEEDSDTEQVGFGVSLPKKFKIDVEKPKSLRRSDRIKGVKVILVSESSDDSDGGSSDSE